MKIVVSSDNHLDVNRISPAEALAFQAQYLNQIKADYYLFAGDMFNKPSNYPGARTTDGG